MISTTGLADKIAERFRGKPPEEVLSWALSEYHPNIALASSFSREDIALIAMMTDIRPDARVFALDTGRLNEETYEAAEAVRGKLGVRIEWHFPERDAVEQLERTKGLYSFRESLENRHECCRIRKVAPLSRALSELRAWVTGQRKDQGITRAALPVFETDEAHGGILKINPLADWTDEQVRLFIRDHGLPYNRLHDAGYPSIGCAPCTRAVLPGEDPRAGRWWWERPEHKECGLHSSSHGDDRKDAAGASPRRGEREPVSMDHLDALENQSIYIFREAFRKFKDLGMLWSIGKDSTTLLWLARKAFFGRVPFPLVHIDTNYKHPEMILYRDWLARELGVELIVGRNEEALCEGMEPSKGRFLCCNALKTQGLQQILDKHGFKGIFLGIRRDEEGSRAKERVFSPRDKNFEWKYKDQPPELWDQFNTSFGPETHVRIHPLLSWTELDVWEYIRREQVPVCDLYFARDGKRYRSLGCVPCNSPIESEASSISEIVEELKVTKTPERAGRAQDHEAAYMMQKLRSLGYM